ncbi:MAG: acetylxylan esterase [Planctomycetaceae bacterium]|nr:acetylxylan esterase [Planctomycetaceae bacterium]
MRLNAPLQLALLRFCFSAILIIGATGQFAFGEKPEEKVPGYTEVDLGIDPNQAVAEYFEMETRRIEKKFSLKQVDGKTWLKNKDLYRKQLAEMLGLSPFPKRTPLKTTITGEIVEEDFIVRNLHYQSSPGLYVTANLYLPKKVTKPVPAILYVCGHARVVKDDVSFGNKTNYHYHGVWFAKNGYACLMIDTIQLGELQGIHHGTYSKDMWWWNARGYTPAGVEAWNSIRGIDYLQSLPEVDAERIGITGRSGGGVYSWWTAALDERIKVAVPVAGITSMRNYIVDGCIEGHCDCMFMVNSYGWDFPMIAALVAPRPLLITNTDKDRIFPLDGVMDVYWQTRHIYEELGAGDKIGIAISEGPHKDTQRLQVNAFEWFNRFLKNEKSEQLEPSEKTFTPEQLKVFAELPTGERTTTIHDSFVPQAAPVVPKSLEQWNSQQLKWKQQLSQQSFHQWPKQNAHSGDLNVKQLSSETQGHLKTTVYSYMPQAPFVLPLYLVEPVSNSKKNDSVTLYVLGEEDWKDFTSGELQKRIVAQLGTTCFVPTRGIGPTAWQGTKKDLTQIRRRFALLGQTLDGMRVWDVRQALHAVRKIPQCKNQKVHLRARGITAGIALFASLYEAEVDGLTLQDLSASQSSGAIFLNVLRIFDTPHALAMAASQCPIQLINAAPTVEDYALQVREIAGSKQMKIQRN